MSAVLQLRSEDRLDWADESRSEPPLREPRRRPPGRSGQAPAPPSGLPETADDAPCGDLDATHPTGWLATRLALSRVLADGAVLKVVIRTGERPEYHAVDRASGETLRHWTEAAFIRLVRGVRRDVAVDVDAGLILRADG